MTDTYARVMRSADGPEDRHTTRSRSPKRPGGAADPVAATDPVAVADAAGVAQDLPVTPIGASGTPVAKPKRSRVPRVPKASANQAVTAAPEPGTTRQAPELASAELASTEPASTEPARTIGTPARTAVPPVRVAVPAARVPGQARSSPPQD